MTVTDVDDIPQAEELPPLDEADEDAPEPESDRSPDSVGPKETGDGPDPPPLPPLLETGASTLATAGSGIYAAAGPVGLVAAAGVATVAGVAYGMHRRTKKHTGQGTSGRGAGRGGGRFFGSPGLRTGRAGRSSRSGTLSARSGRSGGRGTGPAGRAKGRHRASGAGGRPAGAGTGLLGRAGSARSGRPSTGRSQTGRGLLGGALGSRTGALTGAGGRSSRGLGSARSGRSSTGSGTSGRGLLGPAGGRSARSRSRSGGGLFGGSAGRSARRARARSRGRTTAITDPAIPITTNPGRLRRALRAGWNHPRTQRARVRARKFWHKRRVRFRSRSRRLGDYLRKRKWALRMRGWGRGFADWWSRLWDALRTRASDPRYGRLHGWQLTAAAAAIGALGAGKRTTQPRPTPLVGRIIGTAAPTPGEDGPITIAGRALLALTAGEDEELAPEVQRVKDAAEEMKAALAMLGGSQVGMLTYEQGLKQISPILGVIADGLKDMSSTAEDEQPLDPSVLEFFGTIEDAARGASEVADELPGLFRAAHEVELERLENPRRGEHKWDVSQQD